MPATESTSYMIRFLYISRKQAMDVVEEEVEWGEKALFIRMERITNFIIHLDLHLVNLLLLYVLTKLAKKEKVLFIRIKKRIALFLY